MLVMVLREDRFVVGNTISQLLELVGVVIENTAFDLWFEIRLHMGAPQLLRIVSVENTCPQAATTSSADGLSNPLCLSANFVASSIFFARCPEIAKPGSLHHFSCPTDLAS